MKTRVIIGGMLSDKTAVVTGGSSGIGRGIGLVLADYGADVVVADNREEPRLDGTPTHEKIESETDADAKYVKCDVADPEAITEAIDVAESLGGIDVMVNNAAIAQPSDVDVNEARYDRIMDVNLKAVFFGTRIAGERMMNNDGGSIINIASIEGVRAFPDRPVYSTTRRGAGFMGSAFAGHFGEDGIRVNTIHPGLFETAMVTKDIPMANVPEMRKAILDNTPLNRMGEVEEIGKAVVFFASDLSSYVTGTELYVDGGQCATY